MISETLSDLNVKEFYNACETVMDFNDGSDFYSNFRCDYRIRATIPVIECTIIGLDKFDFQGACESILHEWFRSDYFNFQSLFDNSVFLVFVNSNQEIPPYKVEFGRIT